MEADATSYPETTTQNIPQSLNSTTVFLPLSSEISQASTDLTSTQFFNTKTLHQPRNLESIQIIKPNTSAVKLIWSLVGSCVVLVFLGLSSVFVYRKLPARKRAAPDFEMSNVSSSPVKPTENFEGCRIVNYVEQPSSVTLKHSYSSNEIKHETQE